MTPTQRIEFSGVTLDSLIMNPVSTREESLESSEAMYRTSSENTTVDFRINKTLTSTFQAVLPAQLNFKYLQQQQIKALKTVGSYCKKVILTRNNCSGGYKI